MKEYTTTATIAAPQQRVWQVLTDADGYQHWNPEIIGVCGPFAKGARIVAQVRLGDGAVR